jgi:MFS family permease
MSSQSESPPRRHAAVLWSAAFVVIGTLCLIYIISQFLRNSVGVIAPNLAADIGLSAIEIGSLSSAFFFAFAAAQLPLGLALDRFGPKRSMLVCAGLMMLGTVVFAQAETANGLILGRVLLGFGSASFFMAPLALYARWFPPERFSTITGIHLGIGTLGTLLATAPLAFAVAGVGWRTTFLGIGGLAAISAVFIVLLVQDDPPGTKSEPRHEKLADSLAGIVAAIRTPSVGRLFMVHLTVYSSFVLIVGLWGGPYLTHHYGFDLKGRGDILFVPALAQIAGSFFWGPMDRVFGRHKLPVLLGMGLAFGALVLLAALGTMPVAGLLLLLIVLGFASAITPVLIAHGKSLFPPHLIGRGITLLNVGSMGGVFLSQFVSGAVIDLFPAEGGVYPLDAYRLVFALQAAFLLIAFIAYTGAHDPAAEPVKASPPAAKEPA